MPVLPQVASIDWSLVGVCPILMSVVLFKGASYSLAFTRLSHFLILIPFNGEKSAFMAV